MPPPDISMDETAARVVLGEALHALDWAREYREREQRTGPTDGASGENWSWYRRGSAAAAQHDRACVDERLRKLLKLPDSEGDSPAAADVPLTIQPGPGASLWYVTDSGEVVRLDRRSEAQYPCVGRDAAILRGLLDHVRDLLDDPTTAALRTTPSRREEG